MPASRAPAAPANGSQPDHFHPANGSERSLPARPTGPPAGARGDAFARAVATAPAPAPDARPETVWTLGPAEPDRLLGLAIARLVDLQGERRALERQEAGCKSSLRDYAEDRYLEHFAAEGAAPAGAMKVQNDRGQAVTFVVQDRTKGHEVRPATLAALELVLGVDGAAAIVRESTLFGFDGAVLEQAAADGSGRSVRDVLGPRLMDLLDALHAEGLLGRDQVDALLTARPIRTFRPGVLGRLAELCGRHLSRMHRLLEAMGPAVVRYCRA
jgi:hypothetical protein